MTRRTWTRPDLVAIARAVEGGQTWDQAARPYGVTGSTVRTLCKRQGLVPDRQTTPRAHPRTDLVLQAIRHRNVDRVSWDDTAARVGWPGTAGSLRVACYRHVERHGGAVYQGKPREVRRRSTPERDAMVGEARELYLQGFSYRQSGARVGWPHTVEALRQAIARLPHVDDQQAPVGHHRRIGPRGTP